MSLGMFLKSHSLSIIKEKETIKTITITTLEEEEEEIEIEKEKENEEEEDFSFRKTIKPFHQNNNSISLSNNIQINSKQLLPQPLKHYYSHYLPSNHNHNNYNNKNKNPSSLIVKIPNNIQQTPLEQKLFHWEISFHSNQIFYDSDLFEFSDSLWKLIFEKNLSSSSNDNSQNQQSSIFYNLLLYRFLPSISYSHQTLTIECNFEIHCDMKTSYRGHFHSLPSSSSPPSSSSTISYIYPSRKLILSSPLSSLNTNTKTKTKTKTNSNSFQSHSQFQCDGYLNYISSSNLQKYLKGNKLIISANLKLLERKE